MLMHIIRNHNLIADNTLQLPAVATGFTSIRTREDLYEACNWCQQQLLELLPIGQGSNIVFTRDVQALVAQISLPGIDVCDETSDKVYLNVGAGVIWDQLVSYCLAHHYFGIENLTLIPGTVGAAPIQNIGAYGVELKDVFVSLTAINQYTGKVRTFTKDACQFAYRYSIFKEPDYKSYVICDLRLCLHKQFIPQLHYPALIAQAEKNLGRNWQRKQKDISATTLSQWVRAIRQSKLPDPVKLPNVGSFFHNPVITNEHYQKLKQRFPELPCYPAINQHSVKVPGIKVSDVKIPAGWLVEQAGWLGFKDASGAGVHAKQALVLVNDGGATGQDIIDLAHKIQRSIWNRFAVELKIEPCVYRRSNNYIASNN